MEKHYLKMVRDTEERVALSLRIQEKNPASPYYGGFYDKDRVVHVKFAIYRVASMTTAYCNPDTKYFHSKAVENSIMLGLSYIKRQQHENGLFDYVTCNFNSAPDTAFCIKKLIPVYEYLSGRMGQSLEKAAESGQSLDMEQKTGAEGRTAKTAAELTEAEQKICMELGEIIRRGAFGLLEGGFHTPNHRWAIASILAKTGQLFGEEALKKAVFSYLIEGIDCNEDGEFSEKSAGNYNRVNNDAMITLSEIYGESAGDFSNPSSDRQMHQQNGSLSAASKHSLLQEVNYEEYAIRNLRMMLTYFEPDWSVFTANSTRFDKDLLIYPKDYYLEYLQMGVKYQIPEFLDMCNRIFQIVEEKQISSPDFLIWLMLYPEYRSVEWKGCYQRKDFSKFYKESGILRARRGSFSYTVMRDKSNFLYFHNGTIKLAMKVAGSFCEHRAFIPDRMELQEDGSIHLKQIMRGWYYLPFAEKPETSDWWKMDQSRRQKKTGPDMEINVEVKPTAAGLDIRIQTHGVEGAPWRVELALQGIDAVASEHLMLPVHGGEVLVMKEPEMEAYNAKDSILIGPGFGEHRFTDGKEDSELRTPGAVTLYFTDYTGFDHTIRLRNRRELEEDMI